MYCPRDNTALTFTSVAEKTSHRCQACEGVYVPMTAMPAVRDITQSKILSLEDSALECSRCQVAMKVLQQSQVEIDICPSCRSVWLDPGEALALERAHAQTLPESKNKWHDGIDPISPILNLLSPAAKKGCTQNDSSGLETLGRLVADFFDAF